VPLRGGDQVHTGFFAIRVPPRRGATVTRLFLIDLALAVSIALTQLAASWDSGIGHKCLIRAAGFLRRLGRGGRGGLLLGGNG
jgi:hypothetical protein